MNKSLVNFVTVPTWPVSVDFQLKTMSCHRHRHPEREAPFGGGDLHGGLMIADPLW